MYVLKAANTLQEMKYPSSAWKRQHWHNLGLFSLQQDFRWNIFYNPTELLPPCFVSGLSQAGRDEVMIQDNTWSCGTEQREGCRKGIPAGMEPLLPYQFDRKSAAVIQRCQPQELLRAVQGTVRLPVLLWHWDTVQGTHNITNALVGLLFWGCKMVTAATDSRRDRH